MADDLVQVGRELGGEVAPPLGPCRLLRRPRELLAQRRRRRLVVGLEDVRERHRLAAVGLADRLIVRQVDADRRHRRRIAGLDDDVDGPRRHAGHGRLAVPGVPGHAVLEPLRRVGDRLALPRLVLVDVGDDRFPGALAAARVEVDLDEAVDRVDRRVAIGDPGDVVGAAILDVAATVEADQRPQGLGAGRRRHGARVLEMADDAADGGVVAAADAVDLLDEAGRGLHQPRVQLVALGEAVEVGEGDAVVQVVGAGGEDVLPRRRVLARHHRLERRVEQHRGQAIDEALDRLAITQRQARAGRGRGPDRHGERLARQIDDELARRQRVVRAGMDPHQLGVARRWPAGSPPAARPGAGPRLRGWRAATGCAGSAGRNRCRGRRAPPRRDARRGPWSGSAAPRSHRRSTWTTAASPTRSSRYGRSAAVELAGNVIRAPAPSRSSAESPRASRASCRWRS